MSAPLRVPPLTALLLVAWPRLRRRHAVRPVSAASTTCNRRAASRSSWPTRPRPPSGSSRRCRAASRRSTTTATGGSISSSPTATPHPTVPRPTPSFHNRLYRNLGGFRFEDATAAAGLQGRGYAMGAAVADYDNDGDPDLFVPGVGQPTLYRNLGNGRFEDVTDGRRHRALGLVGGGGVDRRRRGRAARSVRRQLPRLEREGRSLLRRSDARPARLLPPEVLRGPAQPAVPQPR